MKKKINIINKLSIIVISSILIVVDNPLCSLGINSVDEIETSNKSSSANTIENYNELNSRLNVYDENCKSISLNQLDDNLYDGFIFSVNDDAEEIDMMEDRISKLPRTSEVEVVSDDMFLADSLDTINKVAPASIIKNIEPNYVNFLDEYSSTPNDPLYNSYTDSNGIDVSYKNVLNLMNVPKVWSQGYFGGDDVTVAVLDSGVNSNHSDLLGKVTENKIARGGKIQNYNGEDPFFHASFVSGIICAENNNKEGITGAMPNTRVVSIKIFEKESNGKDEYYVTRNSDVISAIEYAIKDDVDVINLSFHTSIWSDEVRKACEEAAESGIILVAASGNDSSMYLNKSAYPAAYDSVISVGSIDVKTSKRSAFSNIDVDVVAPGAFANNIGYVGLNFDETNEQYTTAAGTSFAAPQVSALAAMVKSIDKGITVDEFRALLASTSKDLGEPGKDLEYGYGLVDYEKMLDAILGEKESEHSKVGVDSSEINVTVQLEDDVYNGFAKVPNVMVYNNSYKLVEGKDYICTCFNNYNVGTAKVVINGINDYCGRIVKYYQIKPKSTSIQSIVAKKNKLTVKWRIQDETMCENRINGYQVQISKSDTFKSIVSSKIIKKYTSNRLTFTKLKRKSNYYVRVRTYLIQNSKKYYSPWSDVRKIKM